jgi:hypothetical protein
MQASGSVQPSLRHAHELLGVSAHADAAQIARAYRRQARRLHPDVSVEPDATEQFSALHDAYRVAVSVAHTDGQQVPTQVPAQVACHNPVVVLGGPSSSGLPAIAGPGQSGVAWLAAGPVHVRPPQRPTLGNEPSPEPGPEPDTGAMSSGEGP